MGQCGSWVSRCGCGKLSARCDTPDELAVPLNIKPLRCPWCQQPVTKKQLREQQQLKTFLNRQPFPCPHCGRQVVCPEQSDTLISVGLLITAILTPLVHFWQISWTTPQQVFALGLAIVIAGILTQKLSKAETHE